MESRERQGYLSLTGLQLVHHGHSRSHTHFSLFPDDLRSPCVLYRPCECPLSTSGSTSVESSPVLGSLQSPGPCANNAQASGHAEGLLRARERHVHPPLVHLEGNGTH